MAQSSRFLIIQEDNSQKTVSLQQGGIFQDGHNGSIPTPAVEKA